MVSIKRVVPITVLAAGLALVPFARSTPDAGEPQPEAPLEPYIELTCTGAPVARGTQPVILLHAVNPTEREVDFKVPRSLHRHRQLAFVGVVTAGTDVRLSAWLQHALENPPLGGGGSLIVTVGPVNPRSREEFVIQDLDLFEPASLQPGVYRLPYGVSYKMSIKRADGHWEHNINRTSSGVLAFTVTD